MQYLHWNANLVIVDVCLISGRAIQYIKWPHNTSYYIWNIIASYIAIVLGSIPKK